MKLSFLTSPLAIVISLFLWIDLLWPSHLKAESKPCPQIMTELESSERGDWDRIPPSLTPLLVNNAALLMGIETVRSLQGWPHGFSSGFWWNLLLDITMTGTTHTIATKRLPAWVPPRLIESFQGKRGYFARATTNTIWSWILTLIVWHSAAATHGATIDVPEAASALALCGGFYYFVQFTKTYLFVKIPRLHDRRLIAKISQNSGPGFQEFLEVATQKGMSFQIPQEEVQLRLMGAFEKIILRMPWEKRLAGIVPEEFLKGIDEGLSSARLEAKRQKLLYRALRHLHKHPHLRPVFLDALHLGSPLSAEESLQIHQAFKSRYWRNYLGVRAGAAIDVTLGGLAGAVLLRGLTESALAD